MRKRDKIVLLVAAMTMAVFVAAMMLDLYGVAVVAILISTVGTLMYLLGDAGLPRRRRRFASRS
jgi:energy-converting hydrogenase Eha subunit C